MTHSFWRRFFALLPIVTQLCTLKLPTSIITAPVDALTAIPSQLICTSYYEATPIHLTKLSSFQFQDSNLYLTLQSMEYTSLFDLSPRIWSDIGEKVGMGPLQRLLMVGSKSLTNCLSGLVFTRLRCSLYRLKPRMNDTVSNLAPRLRVFSILRTHSLTLLFPRLMPEWLYLAAQMVLRREKDGYLGGMLTGIDFSITRSALEEIPWIRNWFIMQGYATLVSTHLDCGEAGFFASLHSMRILIDSPSNWTHKPEVFGQLWGNPPWRRCALAPSSSQSKDLNADSKPCQPAKDRLHSNDAITDDRSSSSDFSPHCSDNGSGSKIYPINMDQLDHLTVLEVEDNTDAISGALEFHLENAPELSFFRLSFLARPSDHDKPLIIKISSESKMQHLKVHNIWFERTAEKTNRPSGHASFGLCTRGVPNIRCLSLAGVAWAPYQRIHRRQLHTLEELRLEHCVIGECAWELQWPPNLRKLSLFNTFIACEPNTDLEDWNKALAYNVPRANDFLRSFNPMTLPLHLKELSVSGNVCDWKCDDAHTDVIRKWNVAALNKLVAERPRDFSVLFHGGYHAEDMVVPQLHINRATLLSKPIPCRNLTKLLLQNGSSITPRVLSYMPASLHTIIYSRPTIHTFALARKLPTELTNEWKDSDVFSTAAKNLLRVQVGRIFWTYLLPVRIISRDIITDPLCHKKSLKIVCLLNWFLRSALLQTNRLPEDGYPEEFSSLDTWAMLYILAHYWREWTIRGRFNCRWILATPIPSEIEGLIWEFSRDNERVAVVEKLEKRSDAARQERRLLKAKLKDSKLKDKILRPDKDKCKKKSIESEKVDLVVLDPEFVNKKRAGSVTAVLVPAPLIKNSPPGFHDFVNFSDVSWSMVLQNLLRLELRAIPHTQLRLLQDACLPMLEHLLVSVSPSSMLTAQDHQFFVLETFRSPLQQLVFYSADGFLLLPITPSKHICTRNLKRLVTCNSMSDVELAAYPELRVAGIIPYQPKDAHDASSIGRGPNCSKFDDTANAYFRKYLQLRREVHRQDLMRTTPNNKAPTEPISPNARRLFKPAFGHCERTIAEPEDPYFDEVLNPRLCFRFPKASTFVFTGAACAIPRPPDLSVQRKSSRRITGALGRLGRWFSAGNIDPSLSTASPPESSSSPSQTSTSSSSPAWSGPVAYSSAPNLFSSFRLSASGESFCSATSDSASSTYSTESYTPASESYFPPGTPVGDHSSLSSSGSSVSQLSSISSLSKSSKKDKSKSKKESSIITVQSALQRALPANFETHFERFTLGPNLSHWAIPDNILTIDLTDSVDFDASPKKARKMCKCGGFRVCPFWHYDSDASLSITLETLRLPKTLTSLKLMAIEPITAESLLSLLPPNLLLLHIYNQTGDANAPYIMFKSSRMLPSLMEDVFTPHISILPELGRITPNWFPTSLWRLVCSGNPPSPAVLPKTITIAIVGGKTVLATHSQSDSSFYQHVQNRGKVHI